MCAKSGLFLAAEVCSGILVYTVHTGVNVLQATCWHAVTHFDSAVCWHSEDKYGSCGLRSQKFVFPLRWTVRCYTNNTFTTCGLSPVHVKGNFEHQKKLPKKLLSEEVAFHTSKYIKRLAETGTWCFSILNVHSEWKRSFILQLLIYQSYTCLVTCRKNT